MFDCLFIHQSSTAYLGLGHRGSSLSREAQISTWPLLPGMSKCRLTGKLTASLLHSALSLPQQVVAGAALFDFNQSICLAYYNICWLSGRLIRITPHEVTQPVM